jgi:membrane peptidoglycan carboxypeptidase
MVSILAGVLAALAALPFVGGIGVATEAAFNGYESLPDHLTTPPLPQRTRIVASDGSLIATIYEQNRVEVPLVDIAPVMRQAIVAVEDGRFYQHHGVDPRGVLRALVGNAGGTGGVTQGGSTLTQQYVKNVFVESAATDADASAARARNLGRKLKEMRYALALERSLTKDQILERYLNIAYFGAGAYGVEAASRRYFNKSAKDLNLVEAATLAGAVQQPVAYDPLRNPNSSRNRRLQVLGRMVTMGYITQAEADQAGAIPTKSFLHPSRPHNGCTTSYAPFFCDYVYRTLLNDPTFGATPGDRQNFLKVGGYTIKTSLDPVAQKAAQDSAEQHIPAKDPSRKVAAVTMVRPSTGEIVAMAENRAWGVKGRGYTTYNFNVGVGDGGSIGAQAGSTFKAFTLAAALDSGISPYEVIDAPQRATFDGFKSCSNNSTFAPYTVNNSTGAGAFNMLQGTAYSINTYFMALELRTGICKPAAIAQKLGLFRGDGTHLQRVPSFTLGTQEVTPLGMATAYAGFANHGIHCDPIAITQIIDRNGKSLPVPSANCKQVIPRQIADSVTTILSQVIDGPLPGRTGAAMSLGRPAAGKTGTVNDSAAVWFVGYTPDLATAVATYDPRGGYGYPMKNVVIGGQYFSQVFGSTLPGPIWRDAMLAALAGTPATPFDLLPLDGLAYYTPPPVSPCASQSGAVPTFFASTGPTACPSPTDSPSASSSSSTGPSPSTTPSPSTSRSPTPGPSPSPSRTTPSSTPSQTPTTSPTTHSPSHTPSPTSTG